MASDYCPKRRLILLLIVGPASKMRVDPRAGRFCLSSPFCQRSSGGGLFSYGSDFIGGVIRLSHQGHGSLKIFLHGVNDGSQHWIAQARDRSVDCKSRNQGEFMVHAILKQRGGDVATAARTRFMAAGEGITHGK